MESTLVLNPTIEVKLEHVDAEWADRLREFVVSAIKADNTTYESVIEAYRTLSQEASVDMALAIKVQKIIKPAYLEMKERLEVEA